MGSHLLRITLVTLKMYCFLLSGSGFIVEFHESNLKEGSNECSLLMCVYNWNTLEKDPSLIPTSPHGQWQISLRKDGEILMIKCGPRFLGHTMILMILI